jgi:hypothetical protein
MCDVIRRLLALLLLVCCGIVVTGGPASACPHIDTSPAALVKDATAVFTGTISETTQVGPGIHYTVAVDEVYKGDVDEQATLITPRDARACGEPNLEEGRPYVFFAASDGGDLRLGQSGAARATDARVAQVERLLGPGTSPTPPEPIEATFTMVADEPTTLARLAAPGVALVIVGLLGLLLVVGLSRRSS